MRKSAKHFADAARWSKTFSRILPSQDLSPWGLHRKLSGSFDHNLERMLGRRRKSLSAKMLGIQFPTVSAATYRLAFANPLQQTTYACPLAR